METTMDVVEMQMEIEKRVEAALVGGGFPPELIKNRMNNIRGFLFYPRGTALSPQTYQTHLLNIETRGTLLSVPYQRVEKAIRNFQI